MTITKLGLFCFAFYIAAPSVAVGATIDSVRVEIENRLNDKSQKFLNKVQADLWEACIKKPAIRECRLPMHGYINKYPDIKEVLSEIGTFFVRWTCDSGKSGRSNFNVTETINIKC